MNILNIHFGGVHKIEILQTGWFTMANPIKIDDLGVPQF